MSQHTACTARRIVGLATGIAALALATAPALATETNWTAELSGKAEVPGPGNPDAMGKASVRIDEAHNLLCYEVTETGLADVTAAHIHKGATGKAGPPAVPLTAPKDGSAKACTTIDPAVAKAIIADPSGYYVNVHSTKYPKGAIRGQLAPAE